MLMFDGVCLPREALSVTDRGIYVNDGNCRFCIFEADPEYDHGLHDTIEEFEASFRLRLRIVKIIPF